jgi:hypothetical protein
VTICWAFATPADDPPVAEAEELAAVAPADALLVVELLPLELQAASTAAAAVIAAPGASQRFHLCVIAFGSSIPPITSGA